MESAAAGWGGIGMRYPDTSFSDGVKWVRKFNKLDKERTAEINWVAEMLAKLRMGASPSGIELYILANMLGRESVTVSECAKDALVLAHGNNADEVVKNLLSMLNLLALAPKKTHQCKKAALNAIEALARAGEAGQMCRIAECLQHFEKRDRLRIARHMEALVAAAPERIDLAELKRTLEGQARKLLKHGAREAATELFGYFERLRVRKSIAGLETRQDRKPAKNEAPEQPLRLVRIV